MKITVETIVKAPIEQVWAANTTPEDIKQWNAASDDWHTTAAAVDLCVGGTFSSQIQGDVVTPVAQRLSGHGPGTIFPLCCPYQAST